MVDGTTRSGRLVDAGETLVLEGPDGVRTTVPRGEVARGVVEVELARSQDEEGDL